MKKLISILIILLVVGFSLTFIIKQDFLNLSKYIDSPGKGIDIYETTLTAGHYTSGIHIPPGTYTIKAISGSGQISSTKAFSGSIDGKGADGSLSVKTSIENAQLPKGIVLTITGNSVVNVLTSTGELSMMTPLRNTARETITLSPGKFESGKDFQEGIYDVIAVDGMGNVTSSNMLGNGISERMGTFDLTTSEFKNLELKKETTLTVNDLTIQLVPSK